MKIREILVIDGQGGGIGKAFIERIKGVQGAPHVIAAGTNALATAAMLKAGADVGVTGENAVLFNAQRAKVIIGPVGILAANALHGELSPAMARAVAESGAYKILIPVAKCNIHIAGTVEKPLADLLGEAVEATLAHLS